LHYSTLFRASRLSPSAPRTCSRSPTSAIARCSTPNAGRRSATRCSPASTEKTTDESAQFAPKDGEEGHPQDREEERAAQPPDPCRGRAAVALRDRERLGTAHHAHHRRDRELHAPDRRARG